MPECQEGEVLTVHRNSTELCCPLYQCGESQRGLSEGVCGEAVALGVSGYTDGYKQEVGGSDPAS